jgi:glycosyltransferase involved in cell wall biosynthesis
MNPQTLINCKWRTHRQMTGVQRYAQELVGALSKSELAFDCATPIQGPMWKSVIWEQHNLIRKSAGYTTLFCPANMAPVLLPQNIRLVLTIHCLRFHFHPENYSKAFVAWYKFMIPKLIARADTILTVSHTVQEEIHDVYPQSVGKVKVVYPGVSSAFGVDGDSGDNSVSLGPYWVYVGNSAPAKNLRVLLEALKLANHQHRICLLGICQDQFDSMNEPQLADQVIPLGHINDTDRVAAILRGAIGLLSPSMYESFDLPTLEAMACGCPVIASDTMTHREIGQDAPLFVPACDAKQWAQMLDRLLDEPLIGQSQSELGLNRASEFSWKLAADQVSHIIQCKAL